MAPFSFDSLSTNIRATSKDLIFDRRNMGPRKSGPYVHLYSNPLISVRMHPRGKKIIMRYALYTSVFNDTKTRIIRHKYEDLT